MVRGHRIRPSASDRVFDTVNYTFLSACFLLVAFPLLFIVAASFSDPFAVKTGRVWIWPVEPTLLAYREVFRTREVVVGYANSLYYTVVGTALNVVMTVMAGYPLSRRDFFGRNVIIGFFTFTMLFSGGLIPFYLVVRSLGMLNSRWAMIVPSALGVWNVIVTRTWFQANLPEELYEASVVDGCGDARFIVAVAVPMSGPILAVQALFYGVGHWNSYFNALIFLREERLFPLQIFLRNILLLNQIDFTRLKDLDELVMKQNLLDLLKYALIVVASVPVLLLYPFIQRYFVRGILVGAIKG